MKQSKQYRIDLSLFIGSIFVLLYILFMNYAYINGWDDPVLVGIMEFITIPFILLGCLIPVVVVFRYISKKTQSRTLSMLTVFFSLLTAFLIGYTTF
ncbi:MAG: hypothetical protein R2783_02160 [Gelidibacter sp.]